MNAASDIVVGKATLLPDGMYRITVTEHFKGPVKKTLDIKTSAKLPVDTAFLFPLKHGQDDILEPVGSCYDGIWNASDRNAPHLDELRKMRDERQKLEAAVAANAKDVDALLALADFQGRHQDFTANITYKEAVDIDKGTRALDAASRFYLAKGLVIDAMNYAQQALQRNPSDKEAKNVLDIALVKSGNLAGIANADLSNAKFENLNLNKQQVPHLKLAGSSIGNFQAADADLSYADFSGLKITTGGTLAHSNLIHANLARAKLYRIAITETDFSHSSGLAVLQTRNARNAKFTEADLQGAAISVFESDISFPAVPLVNGAVDAEDALTAPVTSARASIDFRGANLKGASIAIHGMQIDFRKANLTTAKFETADLRGADFTDANLDEATFKRSIYDCMTKWPHGFDPKVAKVILWPGPPACKDKTPLDFSWLMLGGMNFANLDLHGVSFRGANFGAMMGSPVYGDSTNQARLAHANLSKADLQEADGLNTGSLEGANLDGASLRNAKLIKLYINANPPSFKNTDLRGAHIFAEKAESWNVDSMPLKKALDQAITKGSITSCGDDFLEGARRGMIHDLVRCASRPPEPIDLSGQDLSDINLSSTDLRGVDFQNANLTGAIFDNAVYNASTRWPVGFNVKSTTARFCNEEGPLYDGKGGPLLCAPPTKPLVESIFQPSVDKGNIPPPPPPIH